MPTFVELLDSRRLMYAAGLDPTFGDNGHLSFVEGFRAGYSKAAYFESQLFASGNGGATFVSGTNGNQPYVVKLKNDGTLDPRFGDGGYARIPFEAVRIAYDGANGSLYVSGAATGAGFDDDVVKVTRLRSNGRIDRAFAARGTFTYAPPMPTRVDYETRAAAVVTHMNPLADGSIVLAVDQQTRESSRTTAQQSLNLFKLTPAGTFDTRYDADGRLQLLGGTFGPPAFSGGGQDYLTNTRRGFFSDVQTDARGKTGVVIRFAVGTAENNYEYDTYGPSQDATRGRFEIKSRTVSSRGVIDEASAYSWKLFDGGIDYAGPRFAIKYAGRDRDGVHVVAADAAGSYVYTLKEGVRPARRALAIKGLNNVGAISRSAGGGYVADDGRNAVRLLRNFTRDPGFAVNGVATAAGKYFGYFYNGNPFIDDRGRVLAFEPNGILERFD